ncbi:polysaccharide pyruvyl transferase family protein [Leeuwenhoekiella parthenopeia]|uniref:Polysaccharide pyruvyl transferase family protein n=1 Tax=Leeuwenhoekiella parthenopeia TaxID=2890320 RepID=A0ABS8GX83_9FLAO|nr:polysaccharide pyruvyl transferase family protein [Leeuwenhoekiella parthenopeia]MCC4214255.1 polysaccharide pyruvyl transferase family protein [Leeuwenhoekiella parthenopeia]
MKIIVENSTWNNLGDGFYQFSLYELIKNVFPEADVYFGDGPVERAFHPNQKQLKNALKSIEWQNADLHILSGPMVMALLKTEYKAAIENIKRKGSNYAILSCSCSGLDGEPLNQIRKFLKAYPPIAFASRDPETYEKFKDYVPNAYNGICTAFLVNKLLKVDTLKLDKEYFVSSFYRNPEPKFISDKAKPQIEDVTLKERKGYIPGLPWKINRHLEIYDDIAENLGDLKIVRTVQQVSNKSNNFNFKYPNSYITLNPINFLSAFKGANFTISERVHACAVTLAFGKPARILIDSPRCGIFERFDLDHTSNDRIMKPSTVFFNKIDTEMDLLAKYIRESCEALL